MLFMSDYMEELSGYPASDFLGKNSKRTFGDIMHPEDRETISKNAQAAIDERRPYHLLTVRSSTYRYVGRESVQPLAGCPIYITGCPA